MVGLIISISILYMLHDVYHVHIIKGSDVDCTVYTDWSDCHSTQDLKLNAWEVVNAFYFSAPASKVRIALVSYEFRVMLEGRNVWPGLR